VHADLPRFDWDAANRKHLARHRVKPQEAEQAILDAHMVVVEVDEVAGEERSRVVGMTRKGRVLTVAFTFRGEAIRPITAFDAVARDQESYFEAKETL
jgi:uncharacterized DUF497 family protein